MVIKIATVKWSEAEQHRNHQRNKILIKIRLNIIQNVTGVEYIASPCALHSKMLTYTVYRTTYTYWGYMYWGSLSLAVEQRREYKIAFRVPVSPRPYWFAHETEAQVDFVSPITRRDTNTHTYTIHAQTHNHWTHCCGQYGISAYRFCVSKWPISIAALMHSIHKMSILYKNINISVALFVFAAVVVTVVRAYDTQRIIAQRDYTISIIFICSVAPRAVSQFLFSCRQCVRTHDDNQHCAFVD